MQYTTYLRWGVITGLFASLFIPFVIANGGQGEGLFIPTMNMFFPYITGKNFAFRIIVEIALALYVILAIREPKYRPRGSWIMWSMVGLVAWMALATFTSVDATKSFWSNFERMEGYVGLLHVFAFFVISSAMLAAGNLWERFFNTSIGASMAMGLFALFQALHWFGLEPSSQSGARADTSFGNAAYLAVYMLFNLFLTLFMLARAAEKGHVSPGKQVAYGVALVLQFTGLYLTQTRAALLGAIGGIVVAMLWIVLRWLMARSRGSGFKWQALGKWSLAGLVAVVLFTGAFFAFRGQLQSMGGTIGRLASISFTEKTTISRLFYIWPTALQGASERPVTGWGQENFSYVFNKHYKPAMWDQEQWFDRAHNQFLDWLVAGGFPAFLFYLAMFVAAAWAIIRSELSVPEQAVLLGLLGAYAFNNLLVFDNLVSSIYFAIILAFVHGLSRRELPGAVWLSKPVGDHGIAIAAPVVVLAIAFGGWVLNAPGMARAQALVGALSSAQDPAATLEGYRTALGPVAWPGTPLGYQETTEQLLTYANSVSGANVDPKLKQEFHTLSFNAAQELMSVRQDDARLELFFSSFLGQIGRLPDALAHAKRAAELSPQKQQILFQLGLVYLNMGDKAQALAAFKTAYEAAPENDQARVYYAAGHYQNGDIAAGDALLTERWGTTAVDNDLLLRFYVQLKMHDRVIAVLKTRVDANPKSVDANIALANAYWTAGDRAATLAQLRALQQADPTVAGKVQEIIDQIVSGRLRPGQ